MEPPLVVPPVPRQNTLHVVMAQCAEPRDSSDDFPRPRKMVVFVTHDFEETLNLADRVIVMSRRPARIVTD